MKDKTSENCYFCHLFRTIVYKRARLQVYKNEEWCIAMLLKSVTFVTFFKDKATFTDFFKAGSNMIYNMLIGFIFGSIGVNSFLYRTM
jgi:hypothetical protein